MSRVSNWYLHHHLDEDMAVESTPFGSRTLERSYGDPEYILLSTKSCLLEGSAQLDLINWLHESASLLVHDCKLLGLHVFYYTQLNFGDK